MKIILLKDVPKMGRKFEMKEISDGYALNMLIPRGVAVAATPDMVKKYDMLRSKEEGDRKLRNELLLKNISELNGVTITMTEKANEKGHLFAAVHKAELIPEILKQTRLQVDAEHVVLDKPIKEVGAHQIEVKAGGKSVTFTLDIKAK